MLTIEIVGNGHKLARGPRTVKLENGASKMQPNLYKVVYYQWLIAVAFSKAVPINGPPHCYHLIYSEKVRKMAHRGGFEPAKIAILPITHGRDKLTQVP